jgi:hypothetical protein
MPDARCTRGLVCEIVQRNCTRAYRAAENIRHSLRNGFTAYVALTPGYRAFMTPSPADSWLICTRSGRFAFHRLDADHEASDPHDFAVRFGTARLLVLRPLTEFIPPCNPMPRTMPPRPPQSYPNVR